MELETRKCATKNCTRTFRVLVSSKQTVCSNACAQGPGGEEGAAKARKPGVDGAAGGDAPEDAPEEVADDASEEPSGSLDAADAD